MKVFTTNYHISVNRTLVDDLVSIGAEVVMPSMDFASRNIAFFAPNDEHIGKAQIVSKNQFMAMEPMVLLIPCMQHVEDFMALYHERGDKDVLVYLTANSDAKNWYDPAGVDYLMTHDLHFHRLFEGKYKILYFNQPTFDVPKKDEAQLRKTYDEKKIHLYINNFDQAGFEPEYAAALEFREAYHKATGLHLPFFGYGMPDGWPQPPETHKLMIDSMFTLCFKRRETWGQMANESMQLGTPLILNREFIYSTFEEYLMTPDTAIIMDEGENAETTVKRILDMSFEQYESLVNEAYSQSRMYCNDDIRREKLAWLFDKISKDPKLVT
jgi:hypothetical protein